MIVTDIVLAFCVFLLAVRLMDYSNRLDLANDDIEESIAEIKELKQPEIVRCGECKHRDPEDKKCDCGHDIIWQLPRGDDWYCADAERRTDK